MMLFSTEIILLLSDVDAFYFFCFPNNSGYDFQLLNTNIMVRAGFLAFLLALEEEISVFTTEYDVSCCLYYVEVISFHS